jgi:hypothetical protein
VRAALKNKTADPQARELALQMRRLMSTLEEAQVAVYAVAGNGPAKAAVSDQNRIIALLPDFEQLDELPSLTGGRTWTDGKIQEALALAIEDARTAYRLGYYPPPQNWDGKYHKIRLICLRRGIRLSAKRGYDADQLQDVEEEDSASSTSRRLAVAIASPFEATGIGLRVSITGEPATPAEMHLQLQIDAADLLLLQQQGSRYCGKLALETVGYTDDGRKELIEGPIGLNWSWSEQERNAALKTGLGVDRTEELGARIKRIRLVVLDRRSLALGSVDILVSEIRKTQTH